MSSLLEILLLLFVYYLVHFQTALLPNFIALFVGFTTVVGYTNAKNKSEIVVFQTYIIVIILIILPWTLENLALFSAGCLLGYFYDWLK